MSIATSPAYRSSYNQLDGVGDADRRFRGNFDTAAVLDRLGKVILHAGLERTLAIRLIHRHHTVNDNEVMIEQRGDYFGEPALATTKTPVATIPAHVACIPSVWRCGRAGDIDVLEYGHAELYDVSADFFDT